MKVTIDATPLEISELLQGIYNSPAISEMVCKDISASIKKLRRDNDG